VQKKLLPSRVIDVESEIIKNKGIKSAQSACKQLKQIKEGEKKRNFVLSRIR
jgi:hypothetical protein